MEELRQHVEEEWDSLDQRVIDSAIKNGTRDCDRGLQLTGDISYMHCEHNCFVLCCIAACLLDH